MSDLYKLDNAYVRLALEDWWLFVECYQKLLVSIGVFISVPRLSRKLQKNLKWWKRLFYFWRGLKFPSIQTVEDLRDIERWKDIFVSLNTRTDEDGWVNKRRNLAVKLKQLLINSLKVVVDSKSEFDRSRAQTRIKFALHRLGQLGFGETVSEVVALLKETPWVLHPRRVCRDLALQGKLEELLGVYQELLAKESAEWVYIRSTILKALRFFPLVETSVVNLLQDAAISGQTNLERTMASESLLFLKQFKFGQNDQLTQAIGDSSDDYLSKNYALLKKFNDSSNNGDLEVSLDNRRILNNAFDYARIDPDLKLIYRHEPEILREKFYEGEYPDGSEEFEYCSY